MINSFAGTKWCQKDSATGRHIVYRNIKCKKKNNWPVWLPGVVLETCYSAAVEVSSVSCIFGFQHEMYPWINTSRLPPHPDVSHVPDWLYYRDCAPLNCALCEKKKKLKQTPEKKSRDPEITILLFLLQAHYTHYLQKVRDIQLTDEISEYT